MCHAPSMVSTQLGATVPLNAGDRDHLLWRDPNRNARLRRAQRSVLCLCRSDHVLLGDPTCPVPAFVVGQHGVAYDPHLSVRELPVWTLTVFDVYEYARFRIGS